jgi:predicted nucleotidyltransferase
MGLIYDHRSLVTHGVPTLEEATLAAGAAVGALAAMPGVVSGVVLGSHLNGTASRWSDIDIFTMFDRRITSRERVIEALEEAIAPLPPALLEPSVWPCEEPDDERRLRFYDPTYALALVDAFETGQLRFGTVDRTSLSISVNLRADPTRLRATVRQYVLRRAGTIRAVMTGKSARPLHEVRRCLETPRAVARQLALLGPSLPADLAEGTRCQIQGLREIEAQLQDLQLLIASGQATSSADEYNGRVAAVEDLAAGFALLVAEHASELVGADERT